VTNRAIIRQLARYPVKSMRGEALPHASLTLQGVPDDRRYAFVQTASRSSFPWLTARELPELLSYVPCVGEAGVTVRTPDGAEWPVASEDLRRLIEERSGRSLFLLHDARGSYDAAPISVISQQTVERIAEETGVEPNAFRFRPNLLVDLDEAFDELQWVGRIVRVGDTARVAIIKADERCVMLNLDPITVQSTPAVLKCVVQRHAQCAGVYGTVITPGEVRVGDTVTIES
jgi:uncharacterized protein YcbX